MSASVAPGRPPRRAALAVLLVVGLVAVLTVGITELRGRGASAGPAAATSTDPARFVLPALRGGAPVRLADFRGKPLVVNLFASWCTACRGEAPGFVDLSNRLRGRLHFLGVDSLETGDGSGFAHELGYDQFVLARDVDGQQDSGLHDALGRPGLPVTAFYDGRGRLLLVSSGALPEDVLAAHIHDLFGLS